MRQIIIIYSLHLSQLDCQFLVISVVNNIATCSVSCTSKKYYFGRMWAVGMIFVYPVGVPLYCAQLLYVAREAIKSRDVDNWTQGPNVRVLSPLRFLFDNYQPPLWYFDILETGQRLSMTGLLAVLAQGSNLQIVLGFLLTLSFTKLYASYEPFNDAFIGLLKEIAQWQVLGVYFIALLLSTSALSSHEDILHTLLILTVFANVIFEASRLVLVALFKHTVQRQSQPQPQSQEEGEKKFRSVSKVSLVADTGPEGIITENPVFSISHINSDAELL